jgi:hypothetical protein
VGLLSRRPNAELVPKSHVALLRTQPVAMVTSFRPNIALPMLHQISVFDWQMTNGEDCGRSRLYLVSWRLVGIILEELRINMNARKWN